MAYKILAECNNCGACEPECPNAAIALGADIYEIDAAKCTECVGFHAEAQCAKACPIDVCVTDLARVETEAQLADRARALHPKRKFADPMPSHFRK